MSVNDEKLMAYADGELAARDSEVVEQALAEDPGLRQRLKEQLRLRATLTGHYGPVAAEEVPERLLATLGAAKPEGVTSLGEARERRKAFQRLLWRNFGAIAATLAVGLFAGQLIPSRQHGPFDYDDGMLIARDDLAKALETQLASSQAPTASARIGITFANNEGRICRTFDWAATSGLACQNGGQWAVVATAAHSGQATEYRQAGSPLVMQAAQEMMADAPLDAAQERAAMLAGWRIVRRNSN